MADLDYKKRAEPSSIVGMDSDESETNFMGVSDNQDAYTSDKANTSAVYSELTVGTTAVEVKVGATNLANRKMLHITPKTTHIYWGYDNSVTTVTGTKLFKYTTAKFKYGPSISIWVIAATAGNKANIGEVA